jgi:hypothetical protein
MTPWSQFAGLRNAWNMAAPVSGFRSFGVQVTQRVACTCEEFGCEHWVKGWVSTVIPGSPDAGLLEQACDGRVDGYRRAWSRLEPLQNGFVAVHFEPGQPCLRASTHRIPWAANWYHRDGDWRGNPSGLRRAHPDVQSWADELGQHQNRLIDQRQRYGAE